MLNDFIRFFADGGTYMYVILFIDKFVLVLTIVAVAINNRRFLNFCLGVVLIPFALGVVSYIGDMHSLENALTYAGPEERELLAEAATEMAMNPVKFGFWSSVVFMVPLAIRALLNRKRGQAVQGAEVA